MLCLSHARSPLIIFSRDTFRTGALATRCVPKTHWDGARAVSRLLRPDFGKTTRRKITMLLRSRLSTANDMHLIACCFGSSDHEGVPFRASY